MVGILSIGFLSCQEKKEKDSEQGNVPEAVKMAFQEKYPGENDPDWKQDENGYWESNFKKDGEEYRADFNSDGSWIETESSIKEDKLPAAIRKQIEKNYADYEITEIERVENSQKGLFYDVEFKQDGKNKDVEFKEDGTVIN